MLPDTLDLYSQTIEASKFILLPMYVLYSFIFKTGNEPNFKEV